MTDDLHTTLRAAVEARLALARAATPGPWETPGPDTIAEWSIYAPRRGWMVASAEVNSYPDSASPKLRGGITGDEANRNAAHIAANDPATVIRGCERDLRVLERHAPIDKADPHCSYDWANYRWRMSWPCREIVDLAHAYGIEVGDE